MGTASARLFWITLAFSGAAALAQVNTSSLTGLVKDPSDAVITEAAVKARNLSTGIGRSVMTNSAGYYFLTNLPVGSYEISVEKAGFQKAVATVVLDAAEKGRQDFSSGDR